MDEDADAGDDGIWPRELLVPTIVVTEPEAEPEMEMEVIGTRITPEVERATVLVLRSLLVPRLGFDGKQTQ